MEHLKRYKHSQWGSVIGSEKEIRLAALKDEVELLEHTSGLDYAVRTRLTARIEELEK